jgi:hypothetical protein
MAGTWLAIPEAEAFIEVEALSTAEVIAFSTWENRESCLLLSATAAT